MQIPSAGGAGKPAHVIVLIITSIVWPSPTQVGFPLTITSNVPWLAYTWKHLPVPVTAPVVGSRMEMMSPSQ